LALFKTRISFVLTLPTWDGSRMVKFGPATGRYLGEVVEENYILRQTTYSFFFELASFDIACVEAHFSGRSSTEKIAETERRVRMHHNRCTRPDRCIAANFLRSQVGLGMGRVLLGVDANLQDRHPQKRCHREYLRPG